MCSCHGHQEKSGREAFTVSNASERQDEIQEVSAGFDTIEIIRDLEKGNLCRVVGQSLLEEVESEWLVRLCR